MKTIRVVVVDDSAYSRRTITGMLEGMPNVTVVGYATDGEEGLKRIVDLKPDLVTLDLEMPRMDGFTLLRIIMSSCPTPVIVVSSQSGDDRVFKALELGALDFVAKPSPVISDELLKIKEDLQNKVRSVMSLNMAGIKRREALPAAAGCGDKTPLPFPYNVSGSKIDVVAIGASTGGPPALQRIFSMFPGPPPFSIAVSQHMPVGFTGSFAERLNRSSSFRIKEARDGDLLTPGSVLIAPGGFNMVFQSLGGEVVARVVPPQPEDTYVPSVDAMFTSLAAIYGPRLLSVVLTGMGNDGSRGVREVKAGGGNVVAESEDSAVVYGMPREAIATGFVDRVAPLEGMARTIMLLCGIIPDFD